jgi:signal-transduction protein with cAMP-binding, CBS, and nucleotidyltransferase domain
LCEADAFDTDNNSFACVVVQEIIANEFKRAVIKKVKLLQLLSDFEIDALVQACRLERYNDGQVIITEGEVGNTFHMMKSGEVSVSQNGRCVSTPSVD